MLKQIEISAQRFEFYSLDKGRTWSSSPPSMVAYGRRKKMLRFELQKRFERVDSDLRFQKASSNGFDLVLLSIHCRFPFFHPGDHASPRVVCDRG